MDNIIKHILDGNEIELEVVVPSEADNLEAQAEYNRAFKEYSNDPNIMFNFDVDAVLRKRGAWDDDKQQELEILQKKISNLSEKLTKGGYPLSQAKGDAIEIRKLKNQIEDILYAHRELENHTVESKAENRRLQYLVYVSLLYKGTKTRYYDSLTSALKSKDGIFTKACNIFLNLVFNLDDIEKEDTLEDKFLKNYGFMDEKGRFINKDGHLVDIDGRLINENGFYVNEHGERVNKFGQRIDEDGNFVVEFQPFVDDDGQPIIK